MVHRPPAGTAGYRAGGEEPDLGGQFRVPRRGSVRRREDRERGMSKSAGRTICELTRGEQLRGDGPADRRIANTKWQGQEHFYV